MVQVFREVKRVLRDDGTCWLNLGDSYSSNTKGTGGKSDKQDSNSGSFYEPIRLSSGLKPKDLVGIPWRVAFALQADGWYLRSDIIWHKPNPMPESVQGSHYSRHRVTIEEYEKLSSLRRVEGNHQNGSSNMPGLSEGKISSGEIQVHSQREGDSDGKGTGTASGCEGKTPSILGVQTGTGEQRQISTDIERESQREEKISQLSCPSEERGGRDNGNGMVGNIRPTQSSMLLLQKETYETDDGSRNTIEQRREEYTGKYSTSLSQLQLEEEGQDNSALLIDCPGCEKCEKTGGYILHMSAGRPTKSHEYVFLLSKRANYYYDADAVREEHVSGDWSKTQENMHKLNADRRAKHDFTHEVIPRIGGRDSQFINPPNPSGRNRRSVWTIPTEPYSGAHFATYPIALVEPCIKAGTSERGCCPKCGAGWVRVVEKVGGTGKSWHNHKNDMVDGQSKALLNNDYYVTTTGWQPSCDCVIIDPGTNCSAIPEPIPCTVLDPFAGSGTTLLVARQLGRSGIGLDLSFDYLTQQAKARLNMGDMFNGQY